MNNPNDKPRIKISLGNEVALSTVAASLQMETQLLRIELETAIKEHYYHFASKPLALEFEPKRGYILRATSSVGVLSTPSLLVDIAPKIPELSIGKALGLAQESAIGLLNINNKSLARNALSDQHSYSSVDFLGFSLVDSILSIKHNGFARKFQEVIQPTSKLRGDIAFHDTVSLGGTHLNPLVNTIESSIDLYPNRVIKAALHLCLTASSSKEVQSLAQTLLDSLRDVTLVPVERLHIDDLFIRFSVPRPDYDKALAFSKAIIEGRLLSEKDNTIFTPSFTLDMDKVFESYCTTQIQKLIIPQRFEVLAQQHFRHVITPDVADKSIIPDVLVKDKQTGEITIIDLKNKYSQLRDKGDFKISNADLYQLTYYAKTLNAKHCFVVYPGAKPKVQYPLKSSESQATYEQKRRTKLEEIDRKNKITIFNDASVTLYSYSINLLGSLQDTKRSVASLCQLLVDI